MMFEILAYISIGDFLVGARWHSKYDSLSTGSHLSEKKYYLGQLSVLSILPSALHGSKIVFCPLC